ncbi:MAG: VacJ family lipoprotein [Deltaproteobacteria bacterium]|nr:VacJ family lipoprotein [Deltaproteobacteria bacterium]
MKKRTGLVFLIAILSLVSFGSTSLGQSTATYAPENLFGAQRVELASIQVASLKEASPEENESEPADSSEETVPDPLEPLNRAFFEFNDRLYFWVLKPVATGYKTVVPEEARVCVRNFFNNLAFPVRFVNNVLQGKFFRALEETCGFLVNSTVGLGGLADIATAVDLKRHDEDLGQTLAVHGAGPAFYIYWPFFGPSTLRDTIGMAGDIFLDPLTYLGDYWYAPYSRGLNVVNETSLRIGDYESLKKAALDPYVALRDAFYQNRLSKIRE